MADLTELTSRVPIIVSYRDAKAEDNAALAEFARNSFVDSFGHTYRPEDLARFLDESYSPQIQGRELADPQVETRLAMRGRKIVGYCQVRALGLPIDGVDPKDAIELRRLYLSPMVQGSGIADRMICWAFARARARGAKDVYLGVWSQNLRAQRFYARHGFRSAGSYGFKVGDQIDEELILRASAVPC